MNIKKFNFFRDYFNFEIYDRKMTAEAKSSMKFYLVLHFFEEHTISDFFNRDDEVSMKITDPDENIYTINNKQTIAEIKREFNHTNINKNDDVEVVLEIKKTYANGVISVYNYDTFKKNLNDTSLEDLILLFSDLLKNESQIFFQVYDKEVSFRTDSIIFTSVEEKNGKYNKTVDDHRKQTISNQNDFCFNSCNYGCVPSDFYKIDGMDTDLENLFNTLINLLSIISIASISNVEKDYLRVKYNLSDFKFIEYDRLKLEKNCELYKIHDWAYSGNNVSDKISLIRNLIQLEQTNSCIELNSFSINFYYSLQSNYSLYLKRNLEEYIKLKVELTNFMKDYSKKTSDNAYEMLNQFKKNILAIAVFIFTVIISNISSSLPLENIFTPSITTILNTVLFFSLIYSILCYIEISTKVKSTRSDYEDMKQSYLTILDSRDIQEIFNSDRLINEAENKVKRNMRFFLLIWNVSLCIVFYYIV